jgi:hypothetical protein
MERRRIQILAQALSMLIASQNPPVGALKELPIDEAVNARIALERMKSEIETLKSVALQLHSKTSERGTTCLGGVGDAT